MDNLQPLCWADLAAKTWVSMPSPPHQNGKIGDSATKNRREKTHGGFEIQMVGQAAGLSDDLDQFLAAADERAEPFGQQLGVERLLERLIDGGAIER